MNAGRRQLLLTAIATGAVAAVAAQLSRFWRRRLDRRHTATRPADGAVRQSSCGSRIVRLDERTIGAADDLAG